MGLKIRIPREAWNSCVPEEEGQNLSALEGRRPFELTANAASDDIGVDGPYALTKEPTHCKTKLFCFHYGGFRRQKKGQWQNSITYEQPCLQLTCSNCHQWHLPSLQDLTKSVDQEFAVQGTEPRLEPIRPDIDPRLLNGTWRHIQSRHGSAIPAAIEHPIATAILTPVRPFSSCNHYQGEQRKRLPVANEHDDRAACRDFNILVPTSLLKRTVTVASVETRWRSTPRRSYTARLAFSSHDGKVNFRFLLKERARREKKKAYDRVRRARMKEVRGGIGTVLTIRSRHRVKLVFRSEVGRIAFHGLVQSHAR